MEEQTLFEIEQIYKDKYYPQMLKELRAFKDEYKKECPCEYKRARNEYLKGLQMQNTSAMTENLNLFGMLVKRNRPHFEKEIVNGNIQCLDKEIKRNEEKLKFCERPSDDKRTISGEVIQKAREYPITELLEANGNKNIHCINHEPDKHPSMSIKNNFAYCFVCGWHGDSIDVAMKIWQVSFVEAVRRLVK